MRQLLPQFVNELSVKADTRILFQERTHKLLPSFKNLVLSFNTNHPTHLMLDPEPTRQIFPPRQNFLSDGLVFAARIIDLRIDFIVRGCMESLFRLRTRLLGSAEIHQMQFGHQNVPAKLDSSLLLLLLVD